MIQALLDKLKGKTKTQALLTVIGLGTVAAASYYGGPAVGAAVQQLAAALGLGM